MHSRPDRLGALALAALLAGCLDAGAPWGIVRTTLAVDLAPDASRLEGDRLVTARDYRLALASVEVEVDAVSIMIRADTAAFDPSSPPAGYTLCHNGHCHSDDGRLVPYEEIAGAAETETLMRLGGETVTLALGERAEVPLAGCASEGCEVLEPVALGSVVVALAGLRVTGHAHDGRAESRLPPEGVPFSFEVGAVEIEAALDVGFGPEARLGLALDLALALPPSLFDEIDFSAIGADAPERVRARLGEDATLEVEANRFD